MNINAASPTTPMITAALFISCWGGSGSLLVSGGVAFDSSVSFTGELFPVSGADWVYWAAWAALWIGLHGLVLVGLIFDGPPFISLRAAFLCASLPRCLPPTSFWWQAVSAFCCNRSCFRCWWSFLRPSAKRQDIQQRSVLPWLDQPLVGTFARRYVKSRAVWWRLPSASETRSGLLSRGCFGREYCCARWLALRRCSTRKLRLTDWFAKGLPASNQRLCLEMYISCFWSVPLMSCYWNTKGRFSSQPKLKN